MRQQLTMGRVLRFYIPLAANAVLIMVETPVVIAGVSRLPDAEVQLAAYGLLVALSSALINLAAPLIHTGNALGRTRRAFRLLRRFSLASCLAVTVLSGLVYLTPAYSVVVEGLLGASPTVSAAALPGTQLMLLSSFSIGYRRFYQGVLIRHGLTSVIGWCTIVRAVVVVAVVWLGVSLASWSGATLAGAALAANAAVECALVTGIAEVMLRRRRGGRWEPGPSLRLTYAAVLRFYLPLALMMFLIGLTRPIITAAITRMPEPVLALAAFTVAYGLFNLVYSPLYPLVQIIIALVRDAESYRVVMRFTRLACFAGWLALAGGALSPIADLYLSVVLSVPAHVRAAAMPATVALSLYLLVQGFHNEYQGLLVAARRTLTTQLAAMANLAILALVLLAGVGLGQVSGSVVGSLAYVAGYATEALVLRWGSRDLRLGLVRPAQAVVVGPPVG